MDPDRANEAVAYLFRSRRITRLRIIRIGPKIKIVDNLFTLGPCQGGGVEREGDSCECSPSKYRPIGGHHRCCGGKGAVAETHKIYHQ